MDGDLLKPFWDNVPKGFYLVALDGAVTEGRAIRGYWWGKNGDEPYLHYLLKLSSEASARLKPGMRYDVLPAEGAERRFLAAEGLSVVVPDCGALEIPPAHLGREPGHEQEAQVGEDRDHGEEDPGPPGP